MLKKSSIVQIDHHRTLCKSLGLTDLVIVSSSGQVMQEELHILSTGVISYVCIINLMMPPDVF